MFSSVRKLNANNIFLNELALQLFINKYFRALPVFFSQPWKSRLITEDTQNKLKHVKGDDVKILSGLIYESEKNLTKEARALIPLQWKPNW